MASLTWGQVRTWRLARHHLDRRAPRIRLTAVAGDICGVHAQLMSAAELSLWARVEGIRPEQVQRALWRRRSLVKAWSIRGTLHLLPTREFPLYVAALGTRSHWRRPVWLRFVGLTLEEMDGVIEAIREALDGGPLTREELAEAVAARIGGHARERLLSGWGELLKPASYQGALCFGPSRGASVTFVRPDRWLRSWERLDPEVALREIALRYLHAYGPATHEDFARWWGTEPGPARRLFGSIADGLAEVEVEGHRAWALARDVSGIRGVGPPRSLRLLPNFDPYVLGFRPRDRLVRKEFEDRVFRKAAWVSPVLLVDGRVEGVWEQERRRGRIEVRVEPFERLDDGLVDRVRDEAARLGTFLGAEAMVSFVGAARS